MYSLVDQRMQTLLKSETATSKAIRPATDQYWNNLFAATEPDGIWKTVKSARPRAAASLPQLRYTITDERCLARRSHFFPPATPANLVGQGLEPHAPASAVELTIAVKKIAQVSAAPFNAIPHDEHNSVRIGLAVVTSSHSAQILTMITFSHSAHICFSVVIYAHSLHIDSPWLRPRTVHVIY